MDLDGFIWIYTNLYDLCWFICILMLYLYAFSMCLWAWCGLLACRRRLFFANKLDSRCFFDYVNSGNCQKCQNFSVYGFWDLSKKTSANKSWIWAVLTRPDLSPRPDWWPKWWMVRTTHQTCNLNLHLHIEIQTSRSRSRSMPMLSQCTSRMT